MNTGGSPNPDRWKTLVLVLMLVNTVLVSAVTALQVDATIRTSQANRDSQYYAVLASGSLILAGVQSDYDMSTYTKWLADSQEALVAEYSALQRQAANDQQGFETLTLDSQVYQARANRAESLSLLLTDPTYAPPSAQAAPDISTYLADLHSTSVELVQKQNDASSAYHRWNNKSDSYVAVLTVLAIAFFLLGVAQMARPRVRLIFSIFGASVIGIGILWASFLVVS